MEQGAQHWGKKMNDDRYKERMYAFIKQGLHVPLDSIVRSTSWISRGFAIVRSDIHISKTM
jgi:hypothetical protein